MELLTIKQSDNSAEAAFVIRNNKDRLPAAKGKKLRGVSAPLLNYLGCKRESARRHIWIEGDSASVIAWINSSSHKLGGQVGRLIEDACKCWACDE